MLDLVCVTKRITLLHQGKLDPRSNMGAGQLWAAKLWPSQTCHLQSCHQWRGQTQHHLVQALPLRFGPGAMPESILFAVIVIWRVLVWRGHIKVCLPLDAGTCICTPPGSL